VSTPTETAYLPQPWALCMCFTHCSQPCRYCTVYCSKGC